MTGQQTLRAASAEERIIVREPGAAERSPAGAAARRRTLELGLAIGVPVVLIALWQVASDQGWIDARLYPAPTTIVANGWDLAVDGKLWPDVWVTTRRVVLGFLIGTGIGALLGLVMGTSRTVRAALEPLLDALYVVPKLALLPIFLNMFGIGEGPQLALVAATVFFFVWISTMSAFLAVPEGYREAGAVFGAGRWQMFRHVLLPGALPQIMVGARIAAGVSVLVIVASEFVAATDGLGYLIFNSRALFQNDVMYVGIVCVAVLGVVFSEIIRFLGRRLTPWAPGDRDRVRT
ncbi:ABC transporter permease subunit [Actinomadura sp. NPDC000600]|uniref:ABC transporter permease n=1 Tax=Actinomadura sp. NPDC000600 TaxID=3154262 RepID=UPI003396AFE9